MAALKINLDGTRKFATEQLSRSAKDIADLMTLSFTMQRSTPAQFEADLDKVFEKGRFEKIVLRRQDGTVVYQRQTEKTIRYVPLIFKQYVSVDFPKIETQLFDQGVRFGTLEMRLHLGSFYLTLWNNFKKIGILFFSFMIVAIFGSYFILKALLNTIRQIQNQAEAVSHNEYIINKKISKVPELKRVSIVMNTMVEKVQSIFNRQLEDLKYVRDLQFIEPITGLHNRKYLIQRLNHFLDSDTERAHGHFFLIGLTGMEQNSMSTGHPAIQEFYKSLAGILINAVGNVEHAMAARLSQQEFGIILPDFPAEKAVTTTKNAISGILELIAARTEFSDLISVSGGLAYYNYKDDTGSVLSKADYALSVAKSHPSGTIEVFKEKNDQPVMGKYQWQTMLHSALSRRRFFLTFQSVMSDTKELHREVYINLTDQNKEVHKAAFFMPMAITLGLASRIDKYVLEHAAQYLKNNPEKTLAVNISISFCKERLAIVWLRHFLDDSRSIKKRLFFEIHDIDLIQYPEVCIDLIRIVTQMGFGFGIDQCTLNDTTLNLFKEIKPDYLKIEKDYFEDIEHQGNIEVALNALVTLTDNLSIKLIVTKIEDKKFQSVLISKKIKYFQGFGVSGISPL
jgi:EAL domain-containing protein (putative c-di-GMP-specific phosphodiesterase class I)/GGDEF domain-containing protein